MDSFAPHRTALVVMDYQSGILARLPEADDLVARTRALIDTVRAASGTIAFVRVAFTDEDRESVPETSVMAAAARRSGSELSAGAPQTQVDDRLGVEPDDVVVRKTRVGAFSTTDLDARLRSRGVDTLLLAGVSTSGCVLSTVRDGADRDYRLLVVADACADPDPEIHRFLIERVLPRQAEIVQVASITG